LPARRFQVTRGKDGFLPGTRRFMRLGYLGRWTLSAMANHAAPVFHVVRNGRMSAKWFRDGPCVLQALLVDRDVAGCAAIDHCEIRQPDLLDSSCEMMLQRGAIWTSGNKLLVLALVMPPLVEEILSGCHRQRDQKQQAGQPKTMNWRSEDIPAQPSADPVEGSWRAQEFLQGQTHTHPGPRKSAPTVVRITASIRNQVMIQKESGFALNQF